tara:strand:+ start:11069 stop:11740 length:672 start_codon:yes stop_codon:yes gene_type:complete
MLGLGSSISSSYASLGGFELTDIAGLEMWLKNSTGVAVEQWDDSSGNNNHVTQTDSGKQGALDQGGLDFDGDEYAFTSAIAVTVFTAFFCIEPDDSLGAVLFGNSGTADFLKINHNLTNEFRIKKNNSAVDQLFDHSTELVTDTYVLMFRQNAGNTMTYGVGLDFDTVAVGSSTATTITLNEFSEAAAAGINGTVLEAAMYNSTLTDNEATLVINDISARCGL